MNATLATRADARIAAHAEPTGPSWCQRWVRLTVESLYGKLYEAMLHQASARAAGLAFLNAHREGALPKGVIVIPNPDVKDTRVGDLLYKLGPRKSSPGHVGIRVKGNRVAENSSTRIGRVYRALGYRSLAQYGRIDVAVRLPE
ncbi:MAG: hypothetical protein IT204_19065 [Fimbriimonadaceae bacterium]|nr:hypothetical protein [Fimbriimonadaceae bacterium]